MRHISTPDDISQLPRLLLHLFSFVTPFMSLSLVYACIRLNIFHTSQNHVA